MSKTVSHLQACESLIREHRQMEGLLDEFQRSLSSISPGDAESLRPAFSVMKRIEADINVHFACEEQVLFPAVSPYHPMVLMEVEHEELIAQRDTLLALMENPPLSKAHYEQIHTIGSRFIQEMLDHIAREDGGIFPTCEQSLSDAEKADVIAGMDRIRAEAKTQPIPPISRPERTFEVLQADLAMTAQRPIFSTRLLDSANQEIKHLLIQGGQSLAAHWSPKQLTLICLKGEGIFTANDQQVPLSPGVCIVLAPQLRHAVDARTDCHLLLILNPPTPV